MTENIIDLKKITVEFKDGENQVQAVKNVDLQVEKGDIYGIVGYSGAGKSTLVRVINLLQKPTAGEVHINKQDLLQLKPVELRQARTKIGMIFQHFNLMKSRTILGNVEYPLLKTKLSKSERTKRATKLLKLVGLEQRKNDYPRQLSGGQKQRVAIARALANNPDILISDEATSALDPKTTLSILNLLKQLNETLGLTIVLITHEMQAVKEICNHVAVMQKGEIVERGDIEEIFSTPKKKLTQEFINIATNVGPAVEKVTENPSFQQLTQKQQLVQLNFIGQSTEQPIISTLAKQFDVDGNILFANVEQLHEETLGFMILVLTGENQNITKAIQFLKDNQVRVKLLNKVDKKEVQA
ncbi:methionine ABC transporter ATP-binding protein [Pediococcus ethanolidurans]|uniref:methionine ABC transporter ATP-binding protein n=2 Tax=Pediococcus ethanolidurans TaxID=319653 RepID=UPI001C1EB15F|nr:ATP-binding cassette domain-containing protein [Pediococcus ethanolidurans]MBU7554981.1 ATP-binding cassette domain-containing protein [Pediococcus ethanolidurans]MBU7563787.1 ATP-binding cassette domain-containing protein [Pediococcus ethanolidurans]MCT4397908.1 ATP-binding cassette domain-containing protein [Pediococcus ethanolidurans]MCV3320920.1 ATP-binding cassette domain-containing protein [Pediococcus ethanolidurans]MCV3323637.1 ATP-binding cassette domain-containing protein [Pedioco